MEMWYLLWNSVLTGRSPATKWARNPELGGLKCRCFKYAINKFGHLNTTKINLVRWMAGHKYGIIPKLNNSTINNHTEVHNSDHFSCTYPRDRRTSYIQMQAKTVYNVWNKEHTFIQVGSCIPELLEYIVEKIAK